MTRAIAWHRAKLRFAVSADHQLGEGRCWVTMTSGVGGVHLSLAVAKHPQERAQIRLPGRWPGVPVLGTSDLWRDYERVRSLGVEFRETPRRGAYWIVAGFADVDGNHWDLLQPAGWGNRSTRNMAGHA